MKTIDYWKECLCDAAEHCGLMMTEEQLTCLAESASAGHENYGMAYYSPPTSDRISDIERQHKSKLEKIEREAERYRVNSEIAIKQALSQPRDACVEIGEDGKVTRYDGRFERIQ